MPGQLALDPKYYPSDFSLTVTAPTIILATGVIAIPILYADRNIIIDSASMYLYGGVAVSTNFVDSKLKQVAASAAPTFATVSQDIGSFTRIAVGTTVASTLPLTLTKTNGAVDNNIVPAGSWVWLQTNAAGSITNTPTVVVQIRFRSQF